MTLFLSYRPTLCPHVPQDMARFAADHDLRIVAVVFDEEQGVEEPEVFVSLVEFLPSAGERIRLTTGEICTVESVVHEVAQVERHTILYPVVVVKRTQPQPAVAKRNSAPRGTSFNTDSFAAVTVTAEGQHP